MSSALNRCLAALTPSSPACSPGRTTTGMRIPESCIHNFQRNLSSASLKHAAGMRCRAVPFPSYLADPDAAFGLHQGYQTAYIANLYSSLSPQTAPATSVAVDATQLLPDPAPQQEPLLSRLGLTVLCYCLASQLAKEGQVLKLPRLCEYQDFVRVSKAIMQHGRSTKDQEMLIRRALNSAIPGGSGLFRLLLGKTGGTSKWAAELNALFATLMFGWLVGEMELKGTEVPNPQDEGKMRAQQSVVHIKKCKYLEASGCVSTCLYLCKAPTQAFFTEEAGMPTTLQPDFQTLSCDIIFGQAPLPRELDTAFTQPCFATQCTKLLDQGLHSGHRAAVIAAAKAEC